MSIHLGRARLELQPREINLLLARLEGPTVSFQQGCFTIHSKLPVGLGVTFVAIPRSQGEALMFTIPLDQIRGDRTGGMARFLAGGLWGLLQPYLEKNLRNRLHQYGLPQETLGLTQALQDQSKVALLTVHLPLLNTWLLRPKARPQLQGALSGVQFHENSLTLILDIFA